MEAWGLSDTGNVREQNQDYYRIEPLKGDALLAVVCDGNVMDSMCLPIGGLMSECGADEVMRLLDGMNEAARQLGCQMPAPFMTLSFISLPTVPELGLTDMGLVDVLGHRLIDVETQGHD